MKCKSPERVVLKVGTSVVATDSGRIKRTTIRKIAESVCSLREQGHNVHIVSSGAISAGKYQLSHNKHKALDLSSLPNQQALAALGQSYLTSEYSRAFSRFSSRNAPVAQVLLTHRNFSKEEERENISKTFSVIERLGAIALINENDVVATEELRTDNDRLAVMIGRLIKTDRIVIVSQPGGLLDDRGEIIPKVTQDDYEDFEKFVTGDKTTNGRGGMKIKYSLACQASVDGIKVNIIGENDIENLNSVFSQKPPGTYFEPERLEPS